MKPVCVNCLSHEIEWFDETTGAFIPDWLALLIQAVTENFPRLRWKESWSASLMAFYEAENMDDAGFMKIAMALGAHGGKYKNYSYAFQNWYNNQKSWDKPKSRNGHSPARSGRY